MGKLNMTSAAQKQGTILESNYYPCKITSCETKEAKNGGSENNFVNFTVVSGPFAGTNLRTNFNSKGLDPEIGAPGAKIFMQFMTSLGVKLDPNEDISFDFEAAQDQYIDVYSQPGEYNGKRQNDVTGFRPFSGSR